MAARIVRQVILRAWSSSTSALFDVRDGFERCEEIFSFVLRTWCLGFDLKFESA